MLARWPMRYKLLVGVALLLIMLGALAFSGLRGVYAYRGLAKCVSRRAAELPLASDFARHVSDLRVTLSKTRRLRDVAAETGRPPVDSQILREQFRADYQAIEEVLRRYEEQLQANQRADQQIGDFSGEETACLEIRHSLANVGQLHCDEDWLLNEVKVEMLGEELERLQGLSAELPSYLQLRMHKFAGEVRLQYRTWIVVTWITSVLALVTLGILLQFFYRHLFHPLGVLIEGSRRVAGGDFNHRIHIDTHDEMAELAGAMNAMTIRFQEIRDGLDAKVKQRTMEVVRSEQLASVGILAAGVAHEINNPLASIAICSESLENRLHDIIQTDDAKPDGQHNEEITVLRNYLRMIQDEAFRCKQITERLLDFSRAGDCRRRDTDLTALTQGVIDMVRHLGKYRGKTIRLKAGREVVAPVHPQEMKQVVLNLVTNALEAVDSGGTVTVELNRVHCEHSGGRGSRRAGSEQRPATHGSAGASPSQRGTGDRVELIVSDDGCGMSEEVARQVFEPFFTSRPEGQGTGLGLAITHQIVADHGGRIVATSDGPNCGSRFQVSLPIKQDEEERENGKKAA